MAAISLVIQSKQQKAAWDIGECVEKVEWETHLQGIAGQLTFTFNINNESSTSLQPGDTVYLTEMDSSGKSTVIFWGYIFTLTQNRWGEVDVTCYDQLRYLKASNSYAFANMRASDMIRRMAGDLSLNVGTLAQTGYVFPSWLAENQDIFDIIIDILDTTNANTVPLFYVLYDNAGAITLSEVSSLANGAVIGDGSLVREYTFEEDIDADTFNKIKLARPDKTTGGAYVVETKPTKNVTDSYAQWGVLQKYVVVDANMTNQQMADQLGVYQQYYDRAIKSLTVDALGISGVRAGSLVMVDIQDLGDFNPSKIMMVDRVKHTWENSDHQMNLDIRVLI